MWLKNICMLNAFYWNKVLIGVTPNKNATWTITVHTMANMPLMFRACGFHTFWVKWGTRLHGKCIILIYIRGHNSSFTTRHDGQHACIVWWLWLLYSWPYTQHKVRRMVKTNLYAFPLFQSGGIKRWFCIMLVIQRRRLSTAVYMARVFLTDQFSNHM